jgi:enterochelin esterase-like enzyme
VNVRVPPGTDTVYVTGNSAELGPWRANGKALEGRGPERQTTLVAVQGATLEYKFNLGSWARQATDSAGAVLPSTSFVVSRDSVIRHVIGGFQPDPLVEWKASGVLGTLVYWKDIRSAFLGPSHTVEIWLPPGYDSSGAARYPVLYMADGQNLFDPRVSYAGVDWGVDETIVRLVQQGAIPPVIVVGVWNSVERAAEYSPWHKAPAYARFLIEELKPRVDSAFRTRTDPAHTAVMGSSMGGLISFYLVSHHPEIFGACGCLSTHFALSEAPSPATPGIGVASHPDSTPYIIRDIRGGARIVRGGRFWFDYGTLGLDSLYQPMHEAVRHWLTGQGLKEGRDFRITRYPGANHNETSWRARLADPLTFLFGKGPR